MLRPHDAAAAAAACALALASGAAVADPADDVFTPYATEGVRVISYASGVEFDRDGGRDSQQVLSLGWAPTRRWFTSAYVAWEADDGSRYAIDEWSWLNHVQLTTPGTGPVDIGALCEIDQPHDRGEGTSLTCGPTFEVDTDDLQVDLNPSLQKVLHADAPQPTSLGYQWQVQALWRPGVELGAQGFGSVGPWNGGSPAAQQAHTLGPAVFAKWLVPGGHAHRLDAAWLVGLGSGSPKDTLRMRVQQEF